MASQDPFQSLYGRVSSFFQNSVIEEIIETNKSKKNHFKILMVGPSSSGKTTILYRMKLNTHVPVVTIPTIGYNVEHIQYKQYTFEIFDMGGPGALWKEYVEKSKGIIFVHENRRDKLPEAAKDLQRILENDGLDELPVLVYANKEDLPDSVGIEEIARKLGLFSISQEERKWKVQSCNALTGDGLFGGLDWLYLKLGGK